ncbi:MAG TPA: hypothetical protein VLS28_07405 [Candidatus Sulfomarinibacteraceae bacterium]|nr:hypothetical protein [Candidatus Sulfomarinibacteraceae bacterium]
MDIRDRRTNLAFFAAALAAWLVVGGIVLTQDPVLQPNAGYAGAVMMGAAAGLTATPLFWLGAFARARRIVFRGAWSRAIRRGAWVGLIVGIFVILRLQDLFQPPLALFLVAMVLVAESALSMDR